jgi:4-diphosphocytidyl-2-C-methyl-D-erythritol kinase
MVFADVGDELDIAKHDGLYISVEGPFADLLADPRDNLVYKAAMLLAEEHNIRPRAKITLTKNLPLSSGMGGGSSDAAATLKGLVKLWDLPERSDKIEALAKKLGSDVPACLYKKPVWAEGVGEKMTWLQDMPPLHLVLVNPLVPTPTAEVFRRFRGPFSPTLQFSGRRKSVKEWIADLKIYRNDLHDAAIAVTPEIRSVLAALEKTPNVRLHRLSGSGATCFGIYDNENDARTAAAILSGKMPEAWVVTAKTLE